MLLSRHFIISLWQQAGWARPGPLFDRLASNAWTDQSHFTVSVSILLTGTHGQSSPPGTVLLVNMWGFTCMVKTQRWTRLTHVNLDSNTWELMCRPHETLCSAAVTHTQNDWLTWVTLHRPTGDHDPLQTCCHTWTWSTRWPSPTQWPWRWRHFARWGWN